MVKRTWKFNKFSSLFTNNTYFQMYMFIYNFEIKNKSLNKQVRHGALWLSILLCGIGLWEEKKQTVRFLTGCALMVVCGRLLVVSIRLLVFCSCLLVVCDGFVFVYGGLWSFAHGLWLLPVLVTKFINIKRKIIIVARNKCCIWPPLAHGKTFLSKTFKANFKNVLGIELAANVIFVRVYLISFVTCVGCKIIFLGTTESMNIQYVSVRATCTINFNIKPTFKIWISSFLMRSKYLTLKDCFCDKGKARKKRHVLKQKL